MNILVISAQKPDSTGSGVYLAQTARAFVEAGHAVAVVAGIDAADPAELPLGAAYYPVRFNTPELPFNVCGMSDVMPYPATRYRDLTPNMLGQLYAAFAETIGRAVSEFKPDLVLCHHLYLVTALAVRVVRGLAPQVPVAAICHSTDIRQMRSHGLERERVVEGVHGLDRVLSLHEEQARQIVEVYGIDPGRVSIVGTGYDDRVFKRSIEVGAVAPERRIELCYVGKISRAKGVLSLLHAMGELPGDCGDVRLRLVGGAGSAEEDALARELAGGLPASVEVEFCGRVSTQELVDVYGTSDVFVLPSFYEGLPLVTIEAMACGCRVVMTDLPGVRPWLEGHLTDAPVAYVVLPRMLPGTADEPYPAELPAFEGRLARVLAGAISTARRRGRPVVDTTSLTWAAVAQRITEVYYQPRDYIRECYREGKVL